MTTPFEDIPQEQSPTIRRLNIPGGVISAEELAFMTAEMGPSDRLVINTSTIDVNDQLIIPALHTVIHRAFGSIKGPNNKVITPGPREFSVVRYLAERADTDVRKESLFSDIWGNVGRIATVAQTVTYARNHLMQVGLPKTVIQSVPKVGYRFVTELLQ